MDSKELLKKVRKIEIKTRRLSNHLFSGEYHSTFKGRGMTFSEVRQYQYGDDVRAIDWNVTARYNEPFVKVFEEERELTLMLAADISGSGQFGTSHQFKNEVIAEICATLAFSAIQNNDKVGLMLFSDQVELYIPPKKGKSHVLRIIRELIEFNPTHKGTSVANALSFLSSVLKKRAIVFLLSDFISKDYAKTLQVLSNRHDITGVRIYDKREKELPNLGMIKIKDAETNKLLWADTSSKKARAQYAERYRETAAYYKNTFTKTGCGAIEMEVNESYAQKLYAYFKSL